MPVVFYDEGHGAAALLDDDVVEAEALAELALEGDVVLLVLGPVRLALGHVGLRLSEMVTKINTSITELRKSKLVPYMLFKLISNYS